jgi:hypothetical protein
LGHIFGVGRVASGEQGGSNEDDGDFMHVYETTFVVLRLSGPGDSGVP